MGGLPQALLVHLKLDIPERTDHKVVNLWRYSNVATHERQLDAKTFKLARFIFVS